MRLRPSEIRFSQDSINNVFDKHSSHAGKRIGETLDDLCEGRCTIESIPTITVVKEGGRWISADNRRLWVFRQLERLGKCETVSVNIGHSIPYYKKTSNNGGVSIPVRRPPGGYWYTKPSVSRPSTSQFEGTYMYNIANQNASTDHRSTGLATGLTGLEYRSRAFEMSSRMAGIQQTRPETYNIADQRSSAYHRSTGLATGFTCQENRASAMSSRMVGIQQRRPNTALPATVMAPSLSFQRSLSNTSSESISKYSYGVRVMEVFIPETHPEKYKVISNGIEKCTNCFKRLISKGEVLKPGQDLGISRYIRQSKIGPFLQVDLYKSISRLPILINERGCSLHDFFRMDLNAFGLSSERRHQLEMIYVGEGNLKITVRVRDTEQEFYTKIEVAQNV